MKREAHPHPIFLEVPPEVFRRILYTDGGHNARRSLWRPLKLETNNRCVIEATYV